MSHDYLPAFDQIRDAAKVEREGLVVLDVEVTAVAIGEDGAVAAVDVAGAQALVLVRRTELDLAGQIQAEGAVLTGVESYNFV